MIDRLSQRQAPGRRARVVARAAVTFAIAISLLIPAGWGTLPAAATSPPDPIAVVIDGQTYIFDPPPMVINGRTMVPMRALFEALGAEVFWESDTMTAVGTRDGVEIRISPGSSTPTINGSSVEIDVCAVIIDGRTFLPARFVSEALGDEVVWDSQTRTVSVNRTDTSDPATQTDGEGEGPDTSDVDRYLRSLNDQVQTSGGQTQADLAGVLTDLRTTMVDKISWDVKNTATSFTLVKRYWQKKRWADLVRAPLRALQETLSVVDTLESWSSLGSSLTTGFGRATTVLEAIGLVTSYNTLVQTGEQFVVGLNGPAYSAAVETMVKAADDTTLPPFGFSEQSYTTAIQTHLNLPDLSPVVVQRKVSTPDGPTGELSYGTLGITRSIGLEINGLIADIERYPLAPDFPLDELVEYLRQLNHGLLCAEIKSEGVAYRAYRGGQVVTTTAQLGSITRMYSEFGRIGTAVAERLEIEEKVEIMSVYQAGGNALSLAVRRTVPGAGDTMTMLQSGIVLAQLALDEELRFYSDAETKFYMLPQEMVISLSPELSNLWKIADDTVGYVRHLLGTECAGDWVRLRDLADSTGLRVTTLADGRIELRHPDGTAIRFSRTGIGYEATHNGVRLRLLVRDGQTMIDLDGIRAIGWSDVIKPSDPEQTDEPPPDLDWVSLSTVAAQLDLSVTTSSDLAAITVGHPNGTTITFHRTTHGYRGVHGSVVLWLAVIDGRTMIDRDGLKAIGWL